MKYQGRDCNTLEMLLTDLANARNDRTQLIAQRL